MNSRRPASKFVSGSPIPFSGDVIKYPGQVIAGPVVVIEDWAGFETTTWAEPSFKRQPGLIVTERVYDPATEPGFASSTRMSVAPPIISLDGQRRAFLALLATDDPPSAKALLNAFAYAAAASIAGAPDPFVAGVGDDVLLQWMMADGRIIDVYATADAGAAPDYAMVTRGDDVREVSLRSIRDLSKLLREQSGVN